MTAARANVKAKDSAVAGNPLRQTGSHKSAARFVVISGVELQREEFPAPLHYCGQESRVAPSHAPSFDGQEASALVDSERLEDGACRIFVCTEVHVQV